MDQPADVRMGSERSFGLVFTVVFVVVGLLPLWSGGAPRWWSLGVATGFLLAALVWPRALRPLNLLWFRFGLLLHRVTNPLIMGLIYFGAVTPMAVVMRLWGRDALNRRFEPEAASYWIRREPPGPPPETMERQF